MADYKQIYRLDRTSRKGGFAEVFLATRKSDGTRVALKRPRMGPQAAERLRREIEVQSGLAHPNIMSIWDADPDKGWFVMPPAIGNLQDLKDSVDEEELASLLVGAADALAIAHRSSHIHRDLTPPNLLAPVTTPGRAPSKIKRQDDCHNDMCNDTMAVKRHDGCHGTRTEGHPVSSS